VKQDLLEVVGAGAVRASRELDFPCVVKPRARTPEWDRNTRLKVFKVDSPDALMAVYDRCRPWADRLVVQEWVEGPDSALFSCNCYYDRDCPGTEKPDCTGYFQCKLNGKLDGTCKAKTVTVDDPAEPVDPNRASDEYRVVRQPSPPPDSAAVAAAVELYVKAYLPPILAGTGRADATFVREAQSVDLGYHHALRHLTIQEAVNEALDATLVKTVVPQAMPQRG